MYVYYEAFNLILSEISLDSWVLERASLTHLMGSAWALIRISLLLIQTTIEFKFLKNLESLRPSLVFPVSNVPFYV